MPGVHAVTARNNLAVVDFADDVEMPGHADPFSASQSRAIMRPFLSAS
jgi:hypothetical protein